MNDRPGFQAWVGASRCLAQLQGHLGVLLTAIEFAYANTLARGSKGGGEKVRVDAAGHVEKQKHAPVEV